MLTCVEAFNAGAEDANTGFGTHFKRWVGETTGTVATELSEAKDALSREMKKPHSQKDTSLDLAVPESSELTALVHVLNERLRVLRTFSQTGAQNLEVMDTYGVTSISTLEHPVALIARIYSLEDGKTMRDCTAACLTSEVLKKRANTGSAKVNQMNDAGKSRDKTQGQHGSKPKDPFECSFCEDGRCHWCGRPRHKKTACPLFKEGKDQTDLGITIAERCKKIRTGTWNKDGEEAFSSHKLAGSKSTDGSFPGTSPTPSGSPPSSPAIAELSDDDGEEGGTNSASSKEGGIDPTSSKKSVNFSVNQSKVVELCGDDLSIADQMASEYEAELAIYLANIDREIKKMKSRAGRSKDVEPPTREGETHRIPAPRPEVPDKPRRHPKLVLVDRMIDGNLRKTLAPERVPQPSKPDSTPTSSINRVSVYEPRTRHSNGSDTHSPDRPTASHSPDRSFTVKLGSAAGAVSYDPHHPGMCANNRKCKVTAADLVDVTRPKQIDQRDATDDELESEAANPTGSSDLPLLREGVDLATSYDLGNVSEETEKNSNSPITVAWSGDFMNSDCVSKTNRGKVILSGATPKYLDEYRHIAREPPDQFHHDTELLPTELGPSDQQELKCEHELTECALDPGTVKVNRDHDPQSTQNTDTGKRFYSTYGCANHSHQQT